MSTDHVLRLEHSEKKRAGKVEISEKPESWFSQQVVACKTKVVASH
jgi:hypothetical protein